MRSRLLMFLLLLSLLIHDAQGRKLISKGSVTADNGLHSLHEAEIQGMKIMDESKSKKWTGSIRKLTMIHIAKKDKNEELVKANSKSEAVSTIGREEQNLTGNSSSKTQKMQEVLGITEMDYTLARRKPPIHN